MLSIRSSADLARALSTQHDPQLRQLLALRQGQVLGDADADLGEYVHLIVVQPTDTVAAVETELGFAIVTHDNGPDFTAPFEWIVRHGDWYEAVLILSDDGFATVLLVADRAGINPRLRALMAEYA